MCNLSSGIINLLEQIVNEEIKHFRIDLQDDLKEGNNYLSTIIKLSLTNLKTNEKYHLIIKQSNNCNNELVTQSFNTEIYFYEKLLPKLIELQKEMNPALNIDIAPKCWITDSNKERKIIILDNLSSSDFTLFERGESFDENHMDLIFKTYAKFHALSFIMKEKDAKEFVMHQKIIKDLSEAIDKADFFPLLISKLIEKIVNNFKGLETSVLDKLIPYVKKGRKAVVESRYYQGTYKIFGQGDCWSSNMLFKYDVSILN